MKPTVMISLIMILSLSSFAQMNYQKNEVYQFKVENFDNRSNTGDILTGCGAGLTLCSILLAATADWDKTSYPYGVNYNSKDPMAIIGFAGIFVGVSMTITGLILKSKGRRKYAYYNEKLNNINVGYYQEGQKKGLTLVYSF